MTETIILDKNFTIEVISNEKYPDCDIYFNNEFGYGDCIAHVNIDLDKAKEIIAALTKFVEVKEKK